MDRGQRRPCAMTECQIASRLTQTNSVNKNFIIWSLSVENFENFVSTLTERNTVARKNHKKRFYNTNLSLVFLESELWRHIILRKTRLFYYFHFSCKFFAAKPCGRGRDGFFRTRSRHSFYYGFFHGIARAGPYGHMIKYFSHLACHLRMLKGFVWPHLSPKLP